MKKDAVKIFEDKTVRTVWDVEQEKWYFAVIDIIEILTNTNRPGKYWDDLKTKLKKQGNKLSEKIGQLKIKSADGKARISQNRNQKCNSHYINDN